MQQGSPPRRRIRSFVRRPGRLTTGQRRALDELLPRYGVPGGQARLDLPALFGRDGRRVLDVGFGDGDALVTTAARFPDIDYLGVEVHEPGVGHLLAMLERARLTNVRIVNRDAVDVIAETLDDESFDAVNLFFPDPWPKKRHRKRRIVQPQFVSSVARILKPGGLFHVATDWADYAEHIAAVMAASEEFAPIAREAADPALVYRPPTKFEARGLRLGHAIVDSYFARRTAFGSARPRE